MAHSPDPLLTGTQWRLPRAVVPHRYTLALEPDLEAARFLGHVVIDMSIEAPVERIVLNAIELEIESVRVDGEEVTFEVETTTERLIVHAARPVGTSDMEITFAGTLNDKLRGWYRSTFTDHNGATHTIATSQMQATDCRRAFPCFDEPDFKAVFDITLIVESHLLAVSNGPEVERTALDRGGSGDSAGKVAVRFAPTMPMSTYLVAVVVGPLEASEPVMVPRLHGDGPDIELRVIHVPGKSHLTAFGLDVGAFALRWFQEYYGIPYPTEKCDMLALPDFAAGAMENLGCITFRENLLLADTATATQFELQTLADVVTHELAHMWFGDLVTMKWWNGIWLNEAFATFMEIACCAAYRPDWLRWTTFSLERSMAFEVDSLASTRSVEFPVEAPADCDGMFDVLTYQKGGSLLRMLEQYLGEEQFRAGVSHYLRTHEYGNTETSDLWDGIEAANPGTPVRRLMDSWIWQPGYPLVSARLDGQYLVLGQQRFAFGDTADATLFVIPLHLRIDGDELKVLLDTDEMRLPLPRTEASVVVNAGGHGVIRVNYDDTLRSRLQAQLGSLTIIDRYNLVDDAWNEVVAGRLTALGFLTFVEGFRDETELAVWQAIAIGLRGVGRLVEGEALDVFRTRVRELVAPRLNALGWTPVEGEGDLQAKLRGLLVGVMAVQGHDADAQARCREILESDAGHDTGHDAGPDPDNNAAHPVSRADPELMAAAVTAVAAVGTDADFDRYLAAFRSASTPQDQLRYLYALAEFPTAEQLDRAIDLAFSGEVRTQNAPFLLNRCIANRWHGERAWKAVRQRWSEANEAFPNNTIVRMIDPVKMLTADEVVADVQSFFSEHPIPQASQTLEQVLERQRVNAALAGREAERLAAQLLSGRERPGTEPGTDPA